MMTENKQRICDLLFDTLMETRDADDIAAIKYSMEDNGQETVYVLFINGAKRIINVTMDSGVAMIRDIMKGLGV